MAAAASSSTVPTVSRTHEGSVSHDAAAMPIAKAAAGGSSGAAASDRSVTHRDEGADRGQLLRPHAEHVPQGLRRVEAAAALALLDDALGEPRAYAWQPCERRPVGVVDVERLGRRRRRRRGGRRGRARRRRPRATRRRPRRSRPAAPRRAAPRAEGRGRPAAEAARPPPPPPGTPPPPPP